MASLEQLLQLLPVNQCMEKKGKFIYIYIHIHTHTHTHTESQFASVCTVAVNKMKANYRVTCHTMVSVQVDQHFRLQGGRC